MTTLAERLAKLPRTRRMKVEDRAKTLIAEEMSLQDLRKARKQTQVRVARKLGINQENVSRIEKRSDLLIATLSGYVQAMGGKLSLVAEFPDRPPIALTWPIWTRKALRQSRRAAHAAGDTKSRPSPSPLEGEARGEGKTCRLSTLWPLYPRHHALVARAKNEKRDSSLRSE